jgi:hypothetical protein
MLIGANERDGGMEWLFCRSDGLKLGAVRVRLIRAASVSQAPEEQPKRISRSRMAGKSWKQEKLTLALGLAISRLGGRRAEGSRGGNLSAARHQPVAFPLRLCDQF